MLIDYIDRMFMRGCIPYTSVDRIKEEDNGLGTIVCKSDIKTSMEYETLRQAYEEAIINDIDIFINEDEDGIDDV